MPLPLFIIFAALMLGSGLAVVFLRNPVSAAMSLVVSFVGLAALFIGLNAYFLGVVQILVYAGAVMVLFLFIIMLLDIRAESGRKWPLPIIVGGLALAFAIVLQIGGVLMEFDPGDQTLADVPLDPAATTLEVGEKTAAQLEAGRLPDVKLIGHVIFSKYGFHLQMIGVLLLIATLGTVILSKREIGDEAPEELAPPAAPDPNADAGGEV